MDMNPPPRSEGHPGSDEDDSSDDDSFGVDMSPQRAEDTRMMSRTRRNRGAAGAPTQPTGGKKRRRRKTSKYFNPSLEQPANEKIELRGVGQ